jgi:hypothetical protein
MLAKTLAEKALSRSNKNITTSEASSGPNFTPAYPGNGRCNTRINVGTGFILGSIFCLLVWACAPRVVEISPSEGAPGTLVNLSMEYLVGWPRVEIGGKIMDWPQLKLLGLKPESKDVPGEELVWIEDKILQFRIPDLPPGDYTVTIYDDKGPPGDPVYSALETTAYLIFPPVWPFVFRSNQTQLTLRVLPHDPTP